MAASASGFCVLSGAKCVRRLRAGVPAACLTAARGILRRSAQKPPQSRLHLRTPTASVSGAQDQVPLYERKPSRRIRDRSEARERFADRVTLCQLSAESWESSKKTMQSGLKSANIVVLNKIQRGTGCAEFRWRSRRHEHKNLLKFLRAVSQSARN